MYQLNRLSKVYNLFIESILDLVASGDLDYTRWAVVDVSFLYIFKHVPIYDVCAVKLHKCFVDL